MDIVTIMDRQNHDLLVALEDVPDALASHYTLKTHAHTQYQPTVYPRTLRAGRHPNLPCGPRQLCLVSREGTEYQIRWSQC